jgi:hypothetical protein
MRGIVLERFYDARNKVSWLGLKALSTHVVLDPIHLANICRQLGEHGPNRLETVRGDARR